MGYRAVKKDDYVFEYGEPGDYLYVILEGSVEIQIPDAKKRVKYEEIESEIRLKQSQINEIISRLKEQE